MRDPFRLGLLGGDPIRLVRRLLGQPFLLGRFFGQGLGLGDARRVGFLLSELLERTRGLLAFFLSLQLGPSRLFGFFFGSFLGSCRLLGGLQRRRFALGRLLGQACVEINQ